MQAEAASLKVPLRLLAQLRLLMGQDMVAGTLGKAKTAATLAPMPDIPSVAAFSHVTGAKPNISEVCAMLRICLYNAECLAILYCKTAEGSLFITSLRNCRNATRVHSSK